VRQGQDVEVQKHTGDAREDAGDKEADFLHGNLPDVRGCLSVLYRESGIRSKLYLCPIASTVASR
jgi:hypothetical protein